ncbi:hypothetical protein M8J75_007028 [Diaphorina citri]|nr:hypothetical protein M8J75_007028 [Diaphorina citri]
MSWLKNGTLNSSTFNSGPRSSLACKEYHDPVACYESFKKHWQQVIEVFLKFKDDKCDIKQEDVVIIVNHLDQIIALLINFADKQCLEYLLKEKILDQLCHLSLNCDKNGSDLRVKQLRIYKVLVSKFQTCILNSESFLSPLTKLLVSCHENVFSLDVEKILVSLLHQLCITLFQQNELLEFFFPLQHEKQNTSERFVILSLLVSYIHREEELGRQARDALLLCLALSKDNIHVAQFIIQDSDLCPVLATGLSGLYSSLPRKLDIDSEEWHRFSHEDVNNIPELSAFMLSLDFCNVVIQKSHESVQNELLELLYKGFLEPVLGPALMQENDWHQGAHGDAKWTTDDELIVATAYLELFVRSVSHPGVLHSFIKFILTAAYENKRVIDSLIQRINSSYRLSLVTLSLIDTLVDSNCEDVLLELVLKPLIPCSHIMLSQRSRLTYVDPFAKSAHKFLALIPQLGREPPESTAYSNYYDYLQEARIRIESCYRATSLWTYPYDGESPPHCDRRMEGEAELTSLPSADDGSSGYESFKNSDRHEEEEESEGSPGVKLSTTVINMTNVTPSIGPFLDTMFSKLETMPSQDLYTNLLVTGIISRLAIYPQPLIHSFLLDHSLVFQPSIRSLFQIISSLKQRLETQLRTERHLDKLTREAEKCLLEREDRLSAPARVSSGSQSLGSMGGAPTPSAFERFDNKRKSFSDTIGGFFKRSSKEPQLESCSQGYRYINRSGLDSSKKSRRAVLCAILLTEWLKELAAITQEHTVCSLSLDLTS